MLNAHLTDVVKVGDVLFICKLSAHFALFGSLYVFIRGKMVHYHGDFVFIENLLCRNARKFADCNRRSDVVAEHHIEIGKYQLTCLDLGVAGMSRQNFLRHGHTHVINSCPLNIYDCALISR